MQSKICSKCNVEKSASAFTPRKDRPIGLYSCCKVCKARDRKIQAAERRKREPQRQWALSALSDARYRSDYKVTITVDDVLNLLVDTNRQCVYCDKSFNFSASMILRHDAPSLDQINSQGGYTLENITICCYRCNQIKSDATVDELRQIADRIEKLIQLRQEHGFGYCRD